MKILLLLPVLATALAADAQTKTVKKGAKYDTIIVKHGPKPVKKPAPKPVEKVLPVPEFINQPYYYDTDGNRLIVLENANALMLTKKKTLGLKGAKQYLSMEAPVSRVRFTSRKEFIFFIKTSGDVIDLTSYIKLYQFIPADQKREATVTSKSGVLNDKEETKGRLIDFQVKMISKDNYQLQLPEHLCAGEYGFVWVKNMELKAFTVFAFGVDWKNSD
jgi:hypothetical protein